MKTAREGRREALRREAGVLIDELLGWQDAHPEATFSEIEEVILQLRQKLGQRMAEQAAEAQEASRPAPGPLCPHCGEEMRYKGERVKRMDTLLGEVKVKRGYYTCSHCGEQVFPPGSPTGGS